MKPVETEATPPAAEPRSDRAAFGLTEWALFAAVGTSWGASYLLIMVGLDAFHPGFITWARVVLGAGVLLAIGRTLPPLEPGDRGRVMLLSLAWVGIPFTLFPLAEQHINSAVTGLLTGATPFFSALFGAWLFNRPSRGAQRLGIFVGFIGVALISVGTSASGGTAGIGVVMVLVATICYGYATNLASPLQKRYGSVPLMARMLAYGVVWTTPFGVFGLWHSHFEIGATLATVVLGVVGTGITFALMASLVGRVGGPRASLVAYLIPVVSLGLGVVFLSETVVAAALLGILLVLGGAVLASRAER